MRQDAEYAAWTAWLRDFRWDFVATPTFRHPTSQAAMLRAVSAWLRPLGPRAYAAVATTRGPRGDRLHVHAVVGGTGRHPLRETLLRESWRRGSIVLLGYAPRRRFIEYLTHQATEIELLGTPVTYRSRR